jgi:hypothetical protein
MERKTKKSKKKKKKQYKVQIIFMLRTRQTSRNLLLDCALPVEAGTRSDSFIV